MNILVTGGAGFIGRNTIDRLIELGHSIYIVDNFATGYECNVHPDAKLYRMSICDMEMKQVFEENNIDYVYHFAAQKDVRQSTENPEMDAEINIQGTIKLLELCKEHSIKRIVFASSGGTVYGEADVLPTPETYPTNPVCPYGISKLASEKYLHYYYVAFGLKYTVFRYGNVFGPLQDPKGEAGVVAIFIQKILERKEFIINGTGDQTRDYVYVEDVVNANVLALDMEGVGVYNIGTGIETSVNDIVEKLALVSPEELNYQHGPAKSGEQMRGAINRTKIKEELGWEPKYSLKEGMKKTWEWFENNQDHFKQAQ